jgi:uncharacterized membrane protein YozB (DUF420 family)
VIHRNLMLSAIAVSACFLTSYLVYHFGPVPEKRFQGTGWLRTAYLAMLVSHVTLAVVILPMIAVSVRHALRKRFDKHVRIARWTFALWMYVSVTGVLVYLSLY